MTIQADIKKDPSKIAISLDINPLSTATGPSLKDKIEVNKNPQDFSLNSSIKVDRTLEALKLTEINRPTSLKIKLFSKLLVITKTLKPLNALAKIVSKVLKALQNFFKKLFGLKQETIPLPPQIKSPLNQQLFESKKKLKKKHL